MARQISRRVTLEGLEINIFPKLIRKLANFDEGQKRKGLDNEILKKVLYFNYNRASTRKTLKQYFYYQPFRRLAFLMRAEITKNGRLVTFEICQGVSSSLANFDLNSEELSGNPTFCSLQNLAKSLNSSVSNENEVFSTIKGLVNQLAGKYLAKNYQYGQIFQKVLDERQSHPRKAIYYVPDKHTVRDRFEQNCQFRTKNFD